MANTRKNREGDKSDETEKPVIDDENDNEVDKNVADAYEEDTKPSEQNDDESTSTSSSNQLNHFLISVVHLRVV